MPFHRLVPLVALALALSGCSAPPELLHPMPTAPPTRGSAPPSGAPSSGAPLPGQPSLPGSGGQPLPQPTFPAFPPPVQLPPVAPPTWTPTPCPGRPSGDQVLTAVRRAPGLPTDATFLVERGPFCAGTWQFTTVRIVNAVGEPPTDSLLAITRGQPNALRLVELGTEVCSTEVSTNAPADIRRLACNG